ncbi:site-2 protease family protein [Granulicella aggregans]|jgi:Zn-dependent protease|uniref:site-2 protease family protein n=1 Tax=Granulicella aggregans TaxID=474949 RepID=UPI0021E0ED3D|nr:site-2 protease family protein [Granulicella aggregans]
MSQDVALAIFEFVVLLLAISIHDAAQAWMAARLGDPTAKMLGRMTLNPVKHFDLLGTLIWPALFIFRSPLVLGWGKPIPITTRNLKRYKDEMFIYLTGPLAHLAAAAVCLLILVVLKHTVAGTTESLDIASRLAFRDPMVSTLDLPPVFPILLFLYYGILVNLLLFAFNLVPLPSLDGGKVLRYFLPYNAQQTFDSWSFYLMIAFFFIGFRIILFILVPMLTIFDNVLNAL